MLLREFFNERYNGKAFVYEVLTESFAHLVFVMSTTQIVSVYLVPLQRSITDKTYDEKGISLEAMNLDLIVGKEVMTYEKEIILGGN